MHFICDWERKVNAGQLSWWHISLGSGIPMVSNPGEGELFLTMKGMIFGDIMGFYLHSEARFWGSL